MKRRLIQFITTYFLFVFIFILQKPIFMGYYYTLYNKVSWTDWFSVIGHGLPLDLSLAGYLTIIPGLLLIASAWTDSRILRQIRRIYFLFVSILLSCIFISDLGLYGYWGFRLDTTPLFYFFSSPKDALASVSIWVVLAGILAMAGYAALLYFVLSRVLNNEKHSLKIPYRRLSVSGVLLLATGLLFIPIRGGFSVSTMNLGKVFFSADQRLNHAAINPGFSLMDSFSRQADFNKQYRFLPPEEADSIFAGLTDRPVTDSIPQLFTTERPNIIMVVLESFSSHLMETLGGTPDVAVNLDELANEGILFTHFFANSFRTDRGLVSIISGYPGQPTTSIMKYTRKTQSLPSIPASLKKEGYDLQYYYGGDADFTNMRSYLVSTGIENIISEDDFPLSERLSKWGVHDHILFNRILTDLKEQPQKEPFFKIVQTSSSHEPFEVPYSRLPNAKLNAFAYTDSCAGDFIRQFKETPLWKNTVVIFVPDHLGVYPEDMDNLSPERYTIPLILVGGAIKEPKKIATYGSQIDIAATLLAQLGIAHNDFTFSKNMLNAASPHFAFFTFPNIFGMVTPDNELVFNCESNTIVLDEGTHKGENLNKGKAYLQKLYDDIAKR
ncbi:LTA synthase family protein [Bacteroides sp.]